MICGIKRWPLLGTLFQTYFCVATLLQINEDYIVLQLILQILSYKCD